MKFYSSKQVWLTLGVSNRTLYTRINQGLYPPMQSDGSKNGRSRGYFEDVFQKILDIKIPKRGRPINIHKV